LEFRLDLWRRKTIVLGLSYDIVCVILGLPFVIQYRRVSDGETDRQTDTR